MKTNENRGSISINIDEKNEMKVVFKPVNDEVWMDRNELCVLFGCSLKQIDEAIDTIFRKDMFRIEDTCRYHIIVGGKRVSYDITEVNLSVAIALAFIMTTPQAKTLRAWFIKQLLKLKNLDIPFINVGQNFKLN
jgi:hypothetical protein